MLAGGSVQVRAAQGAAETSQLASQAPADTSLLS